MLAYKKIKGYTLAAICNPSLQKISAVRVPGNTELQINPNHTIIFSDLDQKPSYSMLSVRHFDSTLNEIDSVFKKLEYGKDRLWSHHAVSYQKGRYYYSGMLGKQLGTTQGELQQDLLFRLDSKGEIDRTIALFGTERYQVKRPTAYHARKLGASYFSFITGGIVKFKAQKSYKEKKNRYPQIDQLLVPLNDSIRVGFASRRKDYVKLNVNDSSSITIPKFIGESYLRPIFTQLIENRYHRFYDVNLKKSASTIEWESINLRTDEITRHAVFKVPKYFKIFSVQLSKEACYVIGHLQKDRKILNQGELIIVQLTPNGLQQVLKLKSIHMDLNQADFFLLNSQLHIVARDLKEGYSSYQDYMIRIDENGVINRDKALLELEQLPRKKFLIN